VPKRSSFAYLLPILCQFVKDYFLRDCQAIIQRLGEVRILPALLLLLPGKFRIVLSPDDQTHAHILIKINGIAGRDERGWWLGLTKIPLEPTAAFC